VIAALVAAVAIAGSGVAAAQAPEPAGELGDRQLAGQRIVTGFEGESPPSELSKMIREGRVSGVILFADNFDTEAEAKRLVDSLRGIRRPEGLRKPLLIAVDQEGGLVKRLPGRPAASAASMGAAGSVASFEQGRSTGNYLDGLGINLNLAPVLDLGIPGGEIARTNRAFAKSPRGVIRTGVEFAKGLREGGVASAAKHFPGFGRATLNTDETSQRISAGAKRLRSEDERPFAAYAEEDGDMVMLANAVYPALDERKPAGLSREIASRELRREAGFDGVSITDSLDAAAITAIGSPAKVGELGAKAGTDVLLFTSLDSAAQAQKALARDLRAGRLKRERFEKSVGRILDLRESLRG
jgi:beta-N-acetylhexosaminidase